VGSVGRLPGPQRVPEPKTASWPVDRYIADISGLLETNSADDGLKDHQDRYYDKCPMK
jgi:hypothetical protein